jgi:hypothetical protein
MTHNCNIAATGYVLAASAQDAVVAAVYGSVVIAGIHRALNYPALPRTRKIR